MNTIFTSDEYSVYKKVMITFRMCEYGESYEQASNAIPTMMQLINNNVVLKDLVKNCYKN